MNVCMLKPTRWDGKSLVEGDTVDVDGSVGKRWIQNGIAALHEAIAAVDSDEGSEEENIKENSENNDEKEGSDALPRKNNPYEGMKPKQLYDLCLKNGLEVEAKQDAAYYIEKLTAAEAGANQ